MLDLIFYLLHLYVGRLCVHTRPVIGNWCVNFLKNLGMSWPLTPTITLTHPPFHPHFTPLIFNFRVLLWSIIFLPLKFHQPRPPPCLTCWTHLLGYVCHLIKPVTLSCFCFINILSDLLTFPVFSRLRWDLKSSLCANCLCVWLRLFERGLCFDTV